MKPVRKTIATLCALVGILASDTAKAQEPKIEDVRAPIVNTYLTTRTRVNDITLKQTFKELIPLAKRSYLEESWIYLHDDGVLLEIGFLERPGSICYDSQVVVNTEAEQPISQIHIHPPQRDYNTELEIKNEGLLSEQADYERQTAKTITIMPSGDDLYSMMRMNQKVFDTIRHYVVSQHGVTEYSLTDEGKKYVEGLDQFHLKELAYSFESLLHDSYDELDICAGEAFTGRYGCPSGEKTDIVDFLFSKIESPYIKLKFTPKEEM